MSKISLTDILYSHGSCSLKTVKMVDYLGGSLIAIVLPKQKSVLTIHQPVQRVLIIRPGGIGDAVFLLPILKLLTEQGISFDILCESRNREVFSSQGYNVYLYDQWGSFCQIFRQKYDAVIDTEQWHYLSAVAAYAVKTDCRIGFATRPWRSRLLNKPVIYDENEYELSSFYRLFEGILRPVNKPVTINRSLTVSDELKRWALGQVPEQSVAISLGGSIRLKRFSLEQLRAIISDVLAKGWLPVLLGGQEAVREAQQLMLEFDHSHIINFVGRLSLPESVAIVDRCQRLISTDTGLMHLGCAVGRPVTAFFSCGNMNKWKPQGEEHKVVSRHVSCAPCARFGYTIPVCGGTFHCMQLKGIPID